MNLSPRDRRALLLLSVAAIVALAIRLWPEGGTASAAAPAQTVAQAEQRLARLREIAASVPAKEAVLKSAAAQAAAREKGLIQADTAAQAQAQLMQIVRKLSAAEVPPIEIRATEIGPMAAYGDYGSVTASLQMECRVEQLVNLLASIAAQPELISTSDLRVTSSSSKEKVVGVRLTVAGLVPKKLIPEKKGPAAF